MGFDIDFEEDEKRFWRFFTALKIFIGFLFLIALVEEGLRLFFGFSLAEHFPELLEAIKTRLLR